MGLDKLGKVIKEYKAPHHEAAKAMAKSRKKVIDENLKNWKDLINGEKSLKEFAKDYNVVPLAAGVGQDAAEGAKVYIKTVKQNYESIKKNIFDK